MKTIVMQLPEAERLEDEMGYTVHAGGDLHRHVQSGVAHAQIASVCNDVFLVHDTVLVSLLNFWEMKYKIFD